MKLVANYIKADQSLVEESITPSITFLSRPGSSGINGSSIQYHLTMPEYPETSQEGVVHIIPTENFSSDKIKGLLTEVILWFKTSFGVDVNYFRFNTQNQDVTHDLFRNLSSLEMLHVKLNHTSVMESNIVNSLIQR